MSDRLSGKVALVTGAARGQGRAHAVRLASEGADIIAIDIAGPLPSEVPYDSSGPDEFEQTLATVRDLGRKVVGHMVDIRDHAALKHAVDEGVAGLGRLDIVVANAGVCIPATWDAVTPEIYDVTMDINAKGTWNTVMASAPHLVTAGGGSIILISSYAGKKVQPFMVPYTASKHAVTGMARAFAAELGRHDIRVNSVHPGGVATPMGGPGIIAALESASVTAPALRTMGTTFLTQTYAEPEEIASVVAFLASDESKFMTSEHIGVDGGAHHF
ncbi:mycofactocin-coupled SDR family oxidoreductase [Rhodococcus rhodochrous]|uniref:3-ketoacyl-ACP reductase n=1 Tax=Rhodococcus rhodochrous KG-21 TaxID=1441923 RepID=A0A0M9WQW3_RHORH|nr:mycofactocin-coupled SDR family oxidoreductase [Rhodococcus rhodochrous]KOS58210.1 3-ketoacyl-ACP reductase [Rhodococcus rhodochrous KG-21]